jgi:indole-3-glycerol phosphate synthase
MNSARRLSLAISEGDGISLLVPVSDLEAARTAELDGAEGIVVDGEIVGLRDTTQLPVLTRRPASEVTAGTADACILAAAEVGEDWQRLRDLQIEVQAAGIETVVGVRDDEELELVLEHVDPEIFLLAPGPPDDDEDPLEGVLDLLPDVPAGKLAIAEVPVQTREHVLALERAGIDAVIVRGADVARLVGGVPPEV